MSKLDEAKPVAGGYDFGEDWLGELEEALDFDLGLSSDAPTSETPASEKTEFHEENLSDVEVMLDADETMPTSEFVAGGATSEASSAEGTESGNRAVVAQVLDIAALQKSLVRQDVSKESAAGGGEGAKKPGHDGQLWQFVSLIVMRLFDDLELLVIQENSEEACDLVKHFGVCGFWRATSSFGLYYEHASDFVYGGRDWRTDGASVRCAEDAVFCRQGWGVSQLSGVHSDVSSAEIACLGHWSLYGHS